MDKAKCHERKEKGSIGKSQSRKTNSNLFRPITRAL
jgi:hypothetical protein